MWIIIVLFVFFLVCDFLGFLKMRKLMNVYAQSMSNMLTRLEELEKGKTNEN